MSTAAPRIALAGNPNTGKTSLFNRLAGARQRVGNYPGVTVDRVHGEMPLPSGKRAALIDIPGTYSLIGRSAEEQIAIRELLGLSEAPAPDLVIFCVDATQLTRNLYLVLQGQELGLRCMVALTMMDEAGEHAPDPEALSALLGCPVLATSPRNGLGMQELSQAAAAHLERPEPTEVALRFTPSAELRQAADRVKAALPDSWPKHDGVALWALMSIDRDDELIDIPVSVREAVLKAVPDAETAERLDDEIIEGRYGWLDAHVTPLQELSPRAQTRTEQLDRVLIHPAFGFVLFIGIMFLIFQSLFAWADPAIGLIEDVFGMFGVAVANALGPSLLTDFVVQGLIGGVGSVVVFLPQILLLFFFIGLLEDCGYMARVAYLMDRIMRSMGLHGRAFVPMLSGFACAIPAVMATRTMERQRDRTLTMMVVPLMTCSARLPVYTLMIGALFPASASLLGVPVQSGLMIAMYLFSVGMALTAAFVLSRTVLPAPSTALILELPPYRLPRLVDVMRMMLQRTFAFLKEAGTVILTCTVILWALLSFPKLDPEEVAARGLSPEQAQGEQLRNSYGGTIGHALEPLIEPLGFDWKIGVGLVGAFAAREVFVATLGVVYNAGEADEESATLREKIRAETHADGSPVYTPLTGLSLMVFFALACQCMSTLAVVKRETRGYRWPAFLFAYMTALAWIASFAVYQGGRALGFG